MATGGEFRERELAWMSTADKALPRRHPIGWFARSIELTEWLGAVTNPRLRELAPSVQSEYATARCSIALIESRSRGMEDRCR